MPEHEEMRHKNAVDFCEQMQREAGYSPNPDCPKCKGSGFVHPADYRGYADYSKVVSCNALGCLISNKRSWKV